MAYQAAKSGLVWLTHHAASLVGRQAVRCNLLSPGVTLTASALATTTEKRRHEALASVRSPRLGKSEGMAAMVAFLFSDDDAFINGRSFLVDGGASPLLTNIALPALDEPFSVPPATASAVTHSRTLATAWRPKVWAGVSSRSRPGPVRNTSLGSHRRCEAALCDGSFVSARADRPLGEPAIPETHTWQPAASPTPASTHCSHPKGRSSC
ncbi:SDR family oxidoreductase [Streptomyces sp. NPDC057963]|uniref:SDR family oxidoreductase n=1 Tax=Streptomyces sp. NPDC057963 TaxID=3346290 RepID=UPI0036EB6705